MVMIEESGVVFGPFAPDSLFHIEASAYVKKLTGIKICEFVWWSADKNTLMFIEAKQSIPHPQRKPAEYQNYFNEIQEKLENSLQLLLAGKLNRPAILGDDIGEAIASFNWEETEIQLLLVIPNAPLEALPVLSDKLEGQLRRYKTIWNAQVNVINKSMAKRIGLLADAA